MTEYIALIDKKPNDDLDDINDEDEAAVLELEEDEAEDFELKSYGNKYRRKSNKKFYIILTILYIIFVVFYKSALQGGDIHFIQDYMLTLGIIIFGSCLAFSINFWIVAFMDTSKRVKTIIYLIHIISIGLYLVYDHGQLFDYHGTYNFMVFCIYFVIGNVVSLILYFWCKFVGGKRFAIQFTLFLVTVLVVEGITLKHYVDIWGNGYGKKMIDNENLCKIKRPLPWFDLLPRGAQNCWMLSQSCSRKEKFDAFFDHSDGVNKLVVRGCQADKITYKIIPETRTMSYQQKFEVLRFSVVDKMNEKEYIYTEPVELEDVEAVYVTCGDQNKLVVGVAKRRVKPAEEEQPIEKLNVLIMYFDAVSRRQFFRNCPKATKKLEEFQKSGIMHLNHFFRYGVIGFNTLRNTHGLFAGIQYDGVHRGVPIWEEFRKRGYVTGVADDLCEDWDTVYNGRTTVSLDHELIAPFCLPEYHERDGNPWGNFKGPFSLRRRCITGQYVHNYALNYTKQFIDLYDGKNPWFFRSSYIEGHESSSEVLGLMDDDLEKFFSSLSEDTLKRTAIFIVSDHGLHMGFSYLFSNQGFTEHKLPMFTTFIPERFLEKYPELRKNLDENEQKLISAFDIYATFRDILDFDISREPPEKLGVGKDISEAKLNSKSISIRSLDGWKKEKIEYNEKREHIVFEEKNKRKEEEEKDNIENGVIEIGSGYPNGTIIWGKSLLRKVPYRTCEQILIYPGDCVCH